MSDTSNYGNVRSRVQWESPRDGIENYLGCVTQSLERSLCKRSTQSVLCVKTNPMNLVSKNAQHTADDTPC